ncbi:MAG: RNA polymerase sigma factor [Alphaproteobacteria bacterium]|nr:RNA polymerase sigma factor [Alphaproteobacteria bacterium]
MADCDLHTRLLGGDETAFTEAYASLNPSMVRVAGAIVGSNATAEEVAQETWLAVIGGLTKFEGKSSFKNWVFAILSNKARTRAKRDGRNVALVLEPDEDDSAQNTLNARFNADGTWSDPPALWEEITPERILAGRQTWQIVRGIIDKLPPAQQAILSLLEGEKLSAGEIASMLGLSQGNVRVHLHRARERIRQTLEREIAASKK